MADIVFGYGSPTIKATAHRVDLSSVNLGNYIKGIHTDKDLSSIAGNFTITLAYAPDTKESIHPIQDLVDNLLPNDYIEISIQDQPGHPASFMNGFVDEVSFSEDGSSGANREVTIHGRDYGALLETYSINYFTSSQDLTRYASQENLAYTMGYTGRTTPTDKDVQNFFSLGVSSFVDKLIGTIVNEHHLKNLIQIYNRHIQLLAYNIEIPYYFGADALNLQQFTGTLSDLIQQVQGPPWGEFFIRDEANFSGSFTSSPHLYFRIAPFVRLDGSIAWSRDVTGLNYPTGEVAFVNIDRRDVISSSISRNQHEVYTYFLTTPTGQVYAEQGSDVLAYGLATWAGKKGNPYYDGSSDDQDRVKRARRFGFRMMEAQTPWVLGSPSKSTFRGYFEPVTDKNAEFWDLLNVLNQWVVDSMGNNEKLYSGELTCRGVHGIRIGDYVQYNGRYYYVQGVSVDWNEGSAITEHLQLIRGQELNALASHTKGAV